jgi:formylglycine-generating enzyme required for sulfatase activity/dienelactone hydrolase
MSADPSTCITCDTPLPPEARFCISCGTPTPTEAGAILFSGGMSDAQVAQLTAALVDRYAIERELGRGGMAIVYLATDRKLGRPVALKVLRPELAASLGPERFLREIEIAARLTHPNILPLHDCGDAGGLLYYTMPYLEGESLRNRLSREGQLPIEEALQITREVAEALAYAHEQGVIHRDIKPENILLQDGHALVADFGIARAVSAAETDSLTETGLAIGTPVYMSPEQGAGNPTIDGRSDLYSLGCVLYEMLGGETPYLGSTPQAVIAKKLSDPIPRVSVIRETVPPTVEAALVKALAKMPVDRFLTARHFAHALTIPTPVPSAPQPAAVEPPAVTAAPEPERARTARRWRRPAVLVPAGVAVLALAFGGVRYAQHRADVRWATEEALPEIERLIEANDVWRNLTEPYHLAVEAEAVLGDDPALAELFRQVARTIDVRTEPSGASVYFKEYEHPEDEWTLLGVTPLEDMRVPIGIFRWKVEKPGFDTVLAAASTWNVGGTDDLLVPYDFVRTLDAEGSAPPGMVRVPATETPVGPLGDFFIGRYEVTNHEYKDFVDAGGYRNPDFWKHPFEEEGRVLARDEAMRRFVDQSGLPGPATWLGGAYPEGEGDYPVSGVSWYEAAAYAEYAGRELPTAEHWNVARGAYTPMVQWPQLGGFGLLAPFTNFSGSGPVPVGSLPGITAYGAYDMPGNVREWCFNETTLGRIVRGGSWEDNTYEFGYARQVPPMDRSLRNGFRLAFYPSRESVPEAAFAPRTPPQLFDARTVTPVPDAVYTVYREQFAYDETPLSAEVEHKEERAGEWVHERVAFDAAYGGERILAHLFLPTNAQPPYQTVVYFPGSASAMMPSSEGLEDYYEFTMFLSYLVRNGRAVLYPVYKGTFERGGPDFLAFQDPASWGTYAYTEYLVQMVKDVRRSLDYLETRSDIDGDRIAYYGMSWGGNLGAIVPAVDERFAASVLVAGGLVGRGRPESSDLTYVTRVMTPTLILNGKYDVYFPPETSAQPMLDLFATPDADKQLILYETDHIPPRTEYIRETLAWLDRYLGPVSR